jgi:hypothetical protein
MQGKQAADNTVRGKGWTMQGIGSATTSHLYQSNVFWGKDGRVVPCPSLYLRMGEDCVIDPTTSLSRRLTSNDEGGQQWQSKQTHNNQIEKHAGSGQRNERGRVDNARQGRKGLTMVRQSGSGQHDKRRGVEDTM